MKWVATLVLAGALTGACAAFAHILWDRYACPAKTAPAHAKPARFHYST